MNTIIVLVLAPTFSQLLLNKIVLEKENSEFKPRLKIDLVLYPARAEGLVNMYMIIQNLIKALKSVCPTNHRQWSVFYMIGTRNSNRLSRSTLKCQHEADESNHTLVCDAECVFSPALTKYMIIFLERYF